MQNSEKKAPVDIQQRTFEYACRIVALHDALLEVGVSQRLLSQLVGSGTSIGANLHEAKSAQSKKDFVNKCEIALKEARETEFWLRIIEARKYVAPSQLAPLLTETNELIAILVTIVKNTKKNL